jgi:hypothetical protein
MNSQKKKFVSLIPLSKEAKYRFFTSMDCFHSCQVIEESSEMLKLVSLNGQYHTTLPKVGNEHWKIEK